MNGQKLKEYRDRSGLTLRQVENATQISNAYLSQLENGKIKKPSTQVLCTLAKLYGQNAWDFLEEVEAIKPITVLPVALKASLEKRVEDLERKVTSLESKSFLHQPLI